MHTPEQPSLDLPATSLRVEVVRHVEDLTVHVAAWKRLVAMAVEPNPFYEPELLIPALEHLADSRVQVVLLWSVPRQNPHGEKVLCGLFPIHLRMGGPLGRTLWRHLHCYLATPLVRRDLLEETLAAFLDWVFEARHSQPFLFPRIAADGLFFRALCHEVQTRELLFWVQDQHHRALFLRAESALAFRERAISYKVRKELARKRRRLGESGQLSARLLDAGEDSTPWADAFLELEARGWKGRRKTALGTTDKEARYLREASTSLHAAGKLFMSKLEFDGRLIASTSTFLTPPGGCCFKITYDEELARFSPGSLHQLDVIDALHERDDIQWLDSCAVPGHPMIEHLWDGRRFIQSIWVVPGSWSGRARLHALGLGYTARHALPTRYFAKK